jgi:hypothetical protein
MNFSGKIYQGLVDEILEVIYKYEETMYVPSVLGCLEIVKHQILLNQLDEEDE